MATTNLPVQLTSFIGRERDLAEVSQLISTARLVTLTGAGGCGKTRLALHTANKVRDTFRDGIWLVDLVMLREPSLVPQFMAQALGVHESPNETLLGSVLHFVRLKQTLLILDNCEHLSDACASLVQSLLLHAPQLHILATSREPFAIPGETSYYVSPLALPPGDQFAHLEASQVTAASGITSPGFIENKLSTHELMEYDAIRLFVERVQAILPNFTLTADNAAVVVDICRRLDGIPLAIELACTRVRVLSLEQISTRLADRFSLLVSGQRLGYMPHHHTLRATMDWSYGLLTAAEQTLLRRLAVFVAGFSLDMVEAICPDESLEQSQILNLLSSLVDKSLVVAETLTRPQARYRLLATIREYALEKLDESGETVPLRDRHLDVYVSRVEEAAPKMIGTYQQIWFNWLEGEHDNIRAALAWALESGSMKSDRIEAGLRIASALYQFWEIRNYRQEGLVWFERLLAQADDGVSLAVHATACTHAAFLAEFVGNALSAIGYGRRAVDLGAAMGDAGKPIRGFALGGLASGMKAIGNHQAVFALQEQFIELFRPLGASYLYYLGMGVLVQGQTALTLGRYDAARTLLDEALTLAREAGDGYRTAMALNCFGDLARCEQKYDQAQTPYEESVVLLRELGAERDLAGTLHNLGHTYLHLGNTARAQALFNESITLQQAQRNMLGITECLIGFAALAVACGLPAAGTRLLAAVVTIGWERHAGTRAWPATQMAYENTLRLVQAQLSDIEFQGEQAAGRSLSLEQAVEYALNLPLSLTSQEGMGAGQVLTVREREITALIAQGRSNGEIADELVISKRTVEKHIANILSKLALASRAQIVRWAIENGLIHTAT
jgi:non-specific serine/threonine protein kinase